ncbi:MAG: hypothetical protein GY707_10120 [Desulfobacteraceae bacterium]|nr:hypothetical protein [Desulfobacteraceae bacterium]
MRPLLIQITFCLIFVFSILSGTICLAEQINSANIKTIIGGQVKASFTGTDYNNNSIQSEFDDGRWYDASTNLRIKSRTFFNDNTSFDCHYVFSYSKGDSLEASEFFFKKYPGSFISQVFKNNFDSDDARLMDLSSEVKEGNDYFISHRLDRFNLSLESDLGKIIIGRQAVTWGNGLLFNPMDIINPFSPYDTERDYKKGDDLAYFETFFERGDDLQFIYVPRRDLQDSKIKFSKSSIGLKYHLILEDMEFDFMAAKHYEDALAGIGYVGTLGNTVFRSDLIYTFANGDMEDDFLSFIVNIDYSWVWFEKNFYGLIEYYYSGLGIEDYSEAYAYYDLSERIRRGEVYGLGKNYLSSSIKIELSPLFNFNFTGIVNLDDPSYLLQSGITWNAAQNLEITIGSNYAIGNKGDEYGQIQIPFSAKRKDTGSSLFLWITMFF